MNAPRGLLGAGVLCFVLGVGQLEGQIREVDAEVGEPGNFRFQAGGHLALAFPQGQFADFVDLGYGLGGWVAFNLDRQGTVALMLDGNFLVYGHQTTRRPLSPTVPFITVDVSTSNNTDSFAQSTNFDDFTFAWTAGGGLRIQVSHGRSPVFIDMASVYHRNGQASYLREGSITDNGNGSITIHPIQSETNLLLVKLGVSASF